MIINGTACARSIRKAVRKQRANTLPAGLDIEIRWATAGKKWNAMPVAPVAPAGARVGGMEVIIE